MRLECEEGFRFSSGLCNRPLEEEEEEEKRGYLIFGL